METNLTEKEIVKLIKEKNLTVYRIRKEFNCGFYKAQQLKKLSKEDN